MLEIINGMSREEIEEYWDRLDYGMSFSISNELREISIGGETYSKASAALKDLKNMLFAMKNNDLGVEIPEKIKDELAERRKWYEEVVKTFKENEDFVLLGFDEKAYLLADVKQAIKKHAAFMKVDKVFGLAYKQLKEDEEIDRQNDWAICGSKWDRFQEYVAEYGFTVKIEPKRN